MFKLLRKLYQIRLLSFVGIYQVLLAVWKEGTNLMALLRISAKLHPTKIAIDEVEARLSYLELWQAAQQLTIALHTGYQIKPGQRVAIACRNHSAHLKALFAISRLGAHVYLLNPEMTLEQFKSTIAQHSISFIIHDSPIDEIINQLGIDSLVTYSPIEANIDALSKKTLEEKAPKIKRQHKGKLIVLTGGSTGAPKPAARKPSIFDFLPPLFALLNQVKLDQYKSVFIATPIYHGFGVASVFTAMILGAEMHLMQSFDAKESCALIDKKKIEVITLVPLMLQRMLKKDSHALQSLKRIIAGGAPLSPNLAKETATKLGPVLYNLYGTSEAGFCILSTPQDQQIAPDSIGRGVQGVKLQILDQEDRPLPLGKVGQIAVQSSWSINKKQWVKTGDMGYLNKDELVFLCGRIDDMIVSGGENVYPIELENILVQHLEVELAAVIGVADTEFGQRLKAFVVKVKHSPLDSNSLLTWLKARVARYQMPVAIEFRSELPLTHLDKVDKKKLS